MLSKARDWVELTTTHPELVEVLRNALNDWNSATPEEKERANGWMLSAALQAEQALYMWREKLINEQSYNGFIGVVVAIARTPGGAEWWQHARHVLGKDISELVDNELRVASVDTPNWLDVFPHLKKGDT